MSKNKFKQALGFYCIYPIIWSLSWLPLWVLYRLSDVFFLLVASVGYRRSVVTSNLKRAFPDKNNDFIRKVRIRFYRHFCDLFVETIALIQTNPQKILKRVEFKNLDLIHESLKNGHDVISVIGHYGNWEWVPTINLQLPNNIVGCSVYRPLKNTYFDRFMVNLRSPFKSINFPLKSTVKEIVKMKQTNQRFVLGLIADQSPSKYELQFWTTFLTQRTPIILGPEKLGKLTGADLYFWQMDKIKRGHYCLTVLKYPGNIKTDPEFAFTKWHVKQLEEQIYRNPEYWLWSHKRWKYQYLYDGQTFE